MKINLFCEELTAFFEAEGKGKGTIFTSKFFGSELFTFASQFHSQSSEN
jgi:hypothetical protein